MTKFKLALAVTIFGCVFTVGTVSAVHAKGDKEVYSKACKICHGSGMMGAPKFGDSGAWSPRIAKGFDTLRKHAIDGYMGCPPKGGKMSLSKEAVVGGLAYMVDQSRGILKFASSPSGDIFMSMLDKKCIDKTGSNSNSAEAHVWSCSDNNKNQIFDVIARGSTGTEKFKFISLKNRFSGKCLGVAGASKADGAKIIQWNCLPVGNQAWEVVKSKTDNSFSLRFKHSGKCLHIEGKGNGAKLTQWTCNSKKPNQRFELYN